MNSLLQENNKNGQAYLTLYLVSDTILYGLNVLTHLIFTAWEHTTGIS